MSPAPEEHFPSSTLKFWKQPEVRRVWQKYLFLPKTVTLEAKNVLTCCGKESMSDLSKTFLTCTSWYQQAFSTPPQIMSNSGPFRYKFKVDDINDVEKEDQHFFFILDFDICGFFGQGEFFNLHSTD
jgi:hypothetical protein